MKFIFVLPLFALLNVACGARILSVFPIPMFSHQNVFRALTQELAKRGHELVIIAPDRHMPSLTENVTEFDLHDLSYDIWRNGIGNIANRVTTSASNDLLDIMYGTSLDVFDAILGHPGITNLINNGNEEFDLVILQCTTRFAYFFTHVFKAPVIGFSSLGGLQDNYELLGAPSHPLLYPDYLQTKVYNLNFWDKVDGLYTYFYMKYMVKQGVRRENRIGKKHFGNDIPDIQELAKNTDLMFLNINPIWDGIRPVPPSVIYIGGIHIKAPKELPKELKSYMDACENGIIYMSFGSNIKSVDLSKDTLKIFLEVFAKLPYCVLWKWESSDLPGKPGNVRTEKWLPQPDLLVHPNVRAFITQGGLQSADEAIAAKVPLIGIPFMTDQGKNVEKFVKHGIGVGLNIKTITVQSLTEAIRQVTTDKSFHANMTRLNALLRDNPMAPLERAVWWTEYLLRHGSARHLRSPAADISFYEYWILDVLAAALGAILACLLLAAFVLRSLFVLARNLLNKTYVKSKNV